MGVVDKTTHTLNCSCGATESQTIVEYGSAYGSGGWQAGKTFERFDVVWGPNGLSTGPTIASSTCNACGKAPTASIS
jgi:outer membrane receptor for ferric coprogen and ferric-rhodotorulic acid